MFQCTVKYEKTLDDGRLQKVSESYLVEAISFTEAERRIIEEMAPFMSGIYEVSDIKKARFAEIFETKDASADRFFRVKLNMIVLDEKSGAEKRKSLQYLVKAADLRDAIQRLDEAMKDSMMDYEIASVADTPIMDIYHAKLS